MWHLNSASLCFHPVVTACGISALPLSVFTLLSQHVASQLHPLTYGSPCCYNSMWHLHSTFSPVFHPVIITVWHLKSTFSPMVHPVWHLNSASLSLHLSFVPCCQVAAACYLWWATPWPSATCGASTPTLSASSSAGHCRTTQNFLSPSTACCAMSWNRPTPENWCAPCWDSTNRWGCLCGCRWGARHLNTCLWHFATSWNRPTPEVWCAPCWDLTNR